MGRKFLLFALILLFFGNSFGQAWVAQQSDFPFNRGIHDIDIVTDDIVWCAATNETGSGSTSIKDYYKTINGGSLWTKFTIPPTGLTGLTIANIQAFDANNAFVLMNPSTLGGKLLKTSDGGANWTTITGAAFSASESFANMVYAFDNNTIVTMGDPRGGYFEIYRTTNGGTDWARVPQSNITNPKPTLKANLGFKTSNKDTWLFGAIVYVAAYGPLWNAGGERGIHKTTDGGKTWSLFINAGDPLGKITKVASIAYEPCSMAWWVSGASTGSFGSAYSTDGGANWITVDSLRVQNIIKFGTNVGYSGNYILAGSGNTGFLKWSCTSTGVDLSQNEAISKGYPNPVQNNYRYESPYLKHSNVVLTIFDMTGRTIESKSFDNFSGYMIENFDFTNKASGLYLLNISINGKQYTQKIVKQ